MKTPNVRSEAGGRAGRVVDVTRRALLAVGAVAAVVVALSGCSGDPARAGGVDRPLIVVTTSILGDVVEEVVAGTADVEVLMKRNVDPHAFDMSAQDAAIVGDADLLVSNGLGLEEGITRHLDAAEANGIGHLVAGEEIETIDYSGGHNVGTPDPHFWMDPARMVSVVDALEERLATSPEFDAEAVAAAADAYRAELEALDDELTESFAAIPPERRALVTNHLVFGYLAERFGFRQVGAVIPSGSTLASPSAAELEGLVDAIQRAGVPTVFAETTQPDRLVQALASEAGMEVEVVELYTDSLGARGEQAGTYLTMMRENAQLMAAGLSR